MNTLQIEVAKDLLNNSDATIQGILLSFIAILLAVIYYLWKSKLADEAYIREQDKANLEMLLSITTAVKEVGTNTSKNTTKLETMSLSVNEILSIIRERLNLQK